jgi:hypothetical protein
MKYLSNDYDADGRPATMLVAPGLGRDGGAYIMLQIGHYIVSIAGNVGMNYTDGQMHPGGIFAANKVEVAVFDDRKKGIKEWVTHKFGLCHKHDVVSWATAADVAAIIAKVSKKAAKEAAKEAADAAKEAAEEASEEAAPTVDLSPTSSFWGASIGVTYR